MFPARRDGDWVMSSVGEDTLIYDRTTNELHTLKPHHVTVWDACTGRHSPTDIARLLHLDAGTVEQYLAQLSAAGLLESRMPHVSRRKLLGTAGVVAGIVSISAPMAAQAHSHRPCLFYNETCIPGGVACCDASSPCGLYAGCPDNGYCC